MRLVDPKPAVFSLLLSGVLVPGLVFIQRWWFHFDLFYENHVLYDLIQEMIAFCALSVGLILFIVGVTPKTQETEDNTALPARSLVP